MVIKVGINGFGRTGRLFLRAVVEKTSDIKVIAINDPNLDVHQMAYLFKYDSIHGKFKGEVKVENKQLVVNGNTIICYHQFTPEEIPWKEGDVEYVVEASGEFVTLDEAKRHQHENGAKRVLVTAPSVDIPTIVLGVNEDEFKAPMTIVSMACSTANALGPLIKVLHKGIGVNEAVVTSIHSLTRSQNIVDGVPIRQKRDWRRGRSAKNLIPTHSGLELSLSKILPEFSGKISGVEYRVPVINVSTLDATITFKKNVKKNEVEKVLKDAMESERYQHLLNMNEDDLVSSDFVGEEFSVTYDSNVSKFIDGTNTAKIIGWFDNEIGYCHRLVELIILMRKKAGAPRDL